MAENLSADLAKCSMLWFIETFGEFPPIIHGTIVSTILLTGLLASFVSGILADIHGRRFMIRLGSFIFGIGAAIETGSVNLVMFIIGRAIAGIGEGLFLSNVYVLLTEISPSKRRGLIGNLAQICITSAIPLGYFICYGTQNISSQLSWRLPLAFQAALALSNAAASIWYPESPRWLIATGRMDEARSVVDQLDFPEEEKTALLVQPLDGLQSTLEMTFLQNLGNMLRQFGNAFARPVRSRTLFACFIYASQQLSGIDGILYYSVVLFAQAGLASAQASFFASGISALLMLAVTIPATIYCDRWGRKTASVTGGCLIFAVMFLIGTLYATDQVRADGGAARWIVIIGIYLYAIIFCATWSLSLRMYLTESLPNKIRSGGTGLALSSNWLANYIVALTTPVFLASSSFGAYYFFAFCTLICTIACAVIMVETKGKTLEEIEQRYTESHASSRSSALLSKVKHAGQTIRLRNL